MHESEMSEREERELPGDADDSMEWLEELAGDTGALWEDPPLEEQAMSDKSGEEPAAESSPGLVDAGSQAGEPEDEPIPEWLIPHLETTELPVGDDEVEAARVEADQDTTMVSARIPTIPDVGDDSDEGDDSDRRADSDIGEDAVGQFDEDLSWLERIASGEGSAIEEPPTMRWGDAGEGAEEEAPAQEDHGAYQIPEVPEDADEAMAWLEQLATRQGAPSEELTTVDAPSAADIRMDEGTAEEVSISSIPEDPDEAVAWLEQLAAQQGAPDEELTALQEETYDLVHEIDPATDDDLDSAIEDLAGVDMPEDSDEALAWLGELAGFEAAEPEIEALEVEAEIVKESPTPAVEHDVVAARAEAEILFAQQQAVEGVEVPAIAELDRVPGEEPEAEAVGVDEEVEDADEMVETGSDVTGDAELAEIEEEIVSEIPVESDVGETAAQPDEDLDWLDSLDEADAVSWLESESVAAEVDQMEDESVGGVFPAESEADDEFVEPVLEARETAFEAPEEVAMDQAETHDVEQLEAARSAVETGDWAAVASEYEALIESGEGMALLISDLETSVETHQHQPILKRLLGDAYVRDGQLERAVDIYRQALDQL
jgi:tetratricopeptide (TPR) repeat protein